MKIYKRMVRIYYSGKHHKRILSGWYEGDYEEFLLNEYKQQYPNEKLKVEYDYVCIGEK